MRRTLWLSVLASLVLLVAGGCKQQETMQPAAQPAPVVASQQEQPPQALPPSVVEKSPTPADAVKPALTEPVKTAPVETTKVTAKAAPVQATPTAVVHSAPTVKAAPTGKTVTYKATNGNVAFDHQQHSGNNNCSSCHPTEPPAKIVLDKDKAHQLCKGCHQQQGSGPTQCTGCHKK